MKKILVYIGLVAVMTACVNDDQYTWEDNFADRSTSDTIKIGIDYDGSSAKVSGDDYGYVTVQGAHVTVKSATNKFLQLSLSGSTADGSLLVYSWKKMGVELNGVNINNPQGPAINNQCSKAFYVTSVSGTVNVLSDGTAYSSAPVTASGDTIDQKATLFSEGQIYFGGTGTLTVNGNAKNGIASDDYIVFEGGVVNVNVAATGSNGVKVNDGMEIQGGTLTIDVKADGARGIKNDSYMSITGGTTTITTLGDCLIETSGGMRDTTSCAGIKCDSIFTMKGGTLTITSRGDGGKGINCAQNVELSGGAMTVMTTGGNEEGKPKAVKSDTGIILSGGSFKATCAKSWACDNGTDSEDPAAHVTIIGTPATKSLAKKEMIVIF